MLLVFNTVLSMYEINDIYILARLNSCISDIRVSMIKNKLKINDSKTEFIIF